MADNESKTTTDHEEIRRWAEDRGGKPATVKGTESGGEDAGILRIDFPGGEEDRLEEISWDDWFEKFDSEKLAFLYQEQVKSGDESRFFKIVTRWAEPLRRAPAAGDALGEEPGRRLGRQPAPELRPS